MLVPFTATVTALLWLEVVPPSVLAAAHTTGAISALTAHGTVAALMSNTELGTTAGLVL